MPRNASKAADAARFTIGVDLGATRIKVGVLDDGGDPVLDDAVVEKTEARSPVEVGVDNMIRAVREARRRAGVPWKRILGVGVGSPGTIDSERGVILEPVNFSAGWFHLPICDRLSSALSVPVLLENDANAFAFGEYSVLPQKPKCLVVLTLGTGLGSGLIRGGKILPSFEAGHVDIRGRRGRECGCGQRGCLEAYVSSTALVRRAQDLIDSGRKTRLRSVWKETRDPVRSVFEMAWDGDSACRRLVDASARYLGDGCRTIMHMHAPDEIHLNGGMSALAGDDFAERTQRYTRERVLPALIEGTRVLKGSLDPQSGWVGAAFLARARFSRAPL